MWSTAFMTAKIVTIASTTPVMSRSGLTRAIPGAQQEREVACGGLNQQLLVNVLLASYIQPVQSAGIQLMGEIPLDPHSPLPL